MGGLPQFRPANYFVLAVIPFLFSCHFILAFYPFDQISIRKMPLFFQIILQPKFRVMLKLFFLLLIGVHCVEMIFLLSLLLSKRSGKEGEWRTIFLWCIQTLLLGGYSMSGISFSQTKVQKVKDKTKKKKK